MMAGCEPSYWPCRAHFRNERNREAAKPNPALEPISFFIGAWDKIGNHRLIPDLDVTYTRPR